MPHSDTLRRPNCCAIRAVVALGHSFGGLADLLHAVPRAEGCVQLRNLLT